MGFSIWLIALIVMLLVGLNVSPEGAIIGGCLVMLLVLTLEKMRHKM
jgi:hypothetical protein